MSMSLDQQLVALLDRHLGAVEAAANKDCLAFYGPMYYPVDDRVRLAVEAISDRKGELLVILHTDGGVVQMVERMVDTLRHHYQDVTVVVPDRAMSAGTIFALSGDSILMSYFSRLGPIDPQIRKDGQLVPALSYLVQFERLLEKDRKGDLTTAEFALMQKQFNLAELHQFEQARELSITLLRKWLAKYKFKDWLMTETRGLVVTERHRDERAAKIAADLNDVTRWHSHGRGISRDTLQNELNLKIDRLEDVQEIAKAVAQYHRAIVDFMNQRELLWNVHTRGYRFR